MKQLLLILLYAGWGCNAQSPIISVQEGDYSIVGAYYKDIDNLLPKFVGTWKYTNGNESFTIKLKKLTSYYEALEGYYIDALVGEYRYVNTNGIEHVNTLSNLLTDIYPYENNIIGTIIKDKDSPPSLKRLQFIFVDPERKNLKQFIVIKYFAAQGSTPEKIELMWIGNSSYVTDDTSPTTIRVPKINYTLIKQ
jgi:hypothetical protein